MTWVCQHQQGANSCLLLSLVPVAFRLGRFEKPSYQWPLASNGKLPLLPADAQDQLLLTSSTQLPAWSIDLTAQQQYYSSHCLCLKRTKIKLALWYYYALRAHASLCSFAAMFPPLCIFFFYKNLSQLNPSKTTPGLFPTQKDIVQFDEWEGGKKNTSADSLLTLPIQSCTRSYIP